jgi:NAD(P)H-dependent FMN reductase
MSAIRIGIIIGSTRPGRNGAQVAEWIRDLAAAHAPGVEFALVDLLDFPLPHFDEPMSPMRQASQHEQAIAWSSAIDGFDGFVFVTPEYNHSISGVLKNAIDYLYAEWNDKAAAIVSYGAAGGTRAAEHLRLILGEVQIADVRQQVALSLIHDFEGFTTLRPTDMQTAQVGVMVDQLVAWAGALRSVREEKAALAA